MKLFFYTILFLMMSGCCMMGTKCDDVDVRSIFYIVDMANGNDLVFGPSKMYDADSIRFFSLVGKDTIDHFYAPEQPYNGGDSMLVVHFNGTISPVYIRLNNSDVDTLRLTYKMQEGSRCCGGYQTIHSITYNKKPVDMIDGKLYKK